MPFSLRGDVSAAHSINGMVLLDERTGRYWQLNATATLVLRALLCGAAPGEVAKRLTGNHPGLSAEQADHDVAGLLAALRRAGLVMS
ncbi:lasso peptide biosynthesis PqqD family chaperone [Nonomuraea sp. NPDC026600]|uniref:lasso peptide biosynthesis PqqD family chaperone n=1 Tax=Nonomuraea sp. NPDC026600 TaxID=3155363 RepID=UPI0033DCAE66